MRELRERAEPALRILCYILAAVVVYELAGVVLRWNPFRGAIVPELPALASATNNPPGGAHGTNLVANTALKGTNGAPHSAATNSTPPLASANTNPIFTPLAAGKGTNLIAQIETRMVGTNVTTNVVASSATNVLATGPPTVEQTNQTVLPANNSATNATTNAPAQSAAKSGGTNSATVTLVSTNGGTNLVHSALATDTNTSPSSPSKGKIASAPLMPGMPGMDFNPFGPPGKHGGDLPPAVQSRISRITDSEILGPVMHPMPMALLGIAGECAFLRSASGQTGLVKPGDSLDDIKLLRIGINRVLIEQDGQKKELMIFSGYGGESLLLNDSTNENKHL